MCSINHNKKAVFIHIPKNGGSYIANILSEYYGFTNYYFHRPDHSIFCHSKDKSVKMHENKLHGTFIYYKTSPFINQRMNMTPEKWNTYTIFSFVRNPYDRLVSGWNYINRYNIPFEKYLHIQNPNDYDYWHVFMSQTRHLLDVNGKIRCDYIGKFETMEDELKTILEKIGFSKTVHKPFLKNNKKHQPYQMYYTNNETIEIANKLFQYDFIHFGYDKIKIDKNNN